jgi:acetyl-CoA carboxylase biotin carboxylase subunit
MRSFSKILIANRGEIAVRIARACREMELGSVAVYSEADRGALHATAADTAICIGPAPSAESYLDIRRLLDAARETGADAIHPGYGFLAENAAFAQAVEDAGLVFIGPTPDSIAAMGDKPAARKVAAEAGVPLAPADENPPVAGAGLVTAAERVGYPVLIKAAAGGGGKGMRIVRQAEQLGTEFEAAGREATSAFGDGRLFLERYIERPRHVEIQVLADTHGDVVHLGERECSIQRRHQKIIEETPSPALTPELRRAMAEAALSITRKVGYRGAGTVEFLLDETGNFFFLEMNTRLQVEHPVTELVTGIDLVQAQLRIAAGEPLWFGQDDISPRGHAFESRICAEDPARGFLPSPGRIAMLREPSGPGVRVDSGVRPGFEIPLYYDPLLAKLCTWGADRDQARRRMIAALNGYVILGCTTGIAFLADVFRHQAFISGQTHTHFIEQHLTDWRPPAKNLATAMIAAAITSLRPLSVAVNTAGVEDQSPWTTLGDWRMGSGKS